MPMSRPKPGQNSSSGTLTCADVYKGPVDGLHMEAFHSGPPCKLDMRSSVHYTQSVCIGFVITSILDH